MTKDELFFVQRVGLIIQWNPTQISRDKVEFKKWLINYIKDNKDYFFVNEVKNIHYNLIHLLIDLSEKDVSVELWMYDDRWI